MTAVDVPRDRTRRGAILALLAFAMLIVSLDQYIVVVALPEIGRDLGSPSSKARGSAGTRRASSAAGRRACSCWARSW
jgi:hypothetical protein